MQQDINFIIKKMVIADYFTLLRIILAVMLFACGILKADIGVAAVLYFLGWFSDNMDGYLARRSKEGHGKLKDWDIFADLLLVMSGLWYVSMRYGSFPPAFVVLYGTSWIILVILLKNDAVFMSFSFGGILLTYKAILKNNRFVALFAVVWGLGTALIKKKALIDHIRRFIKALK